MPVTPQTFVKDRFEANPNDFYETPYKVAKGCLQYFYDNHLNFHDRFLLDCPNVIDVGCGSGIWGKAVKEILPNSHLIGVDIELHKNIVWAGYANNIYYDKGVQTDFLKYDNLFGKPNLIIGNPPFSSKTNKHLAEDLVLHALDLLDYDDYLGFLLKTEFLASARRFENLFSFNPPFKILQMVERINWGSYKSGNTIEYAFFIWRKGSLLKPQVDWLTWK